MRRIHNHKGFSLAEVLMVLGILAILMGVAFLAIFQYLRSMAKLEYDNYAKEIFIAAQNHLSAAESQGYPGYPKLPDGWGEKFGVEEAEIDGVSDTGTGAYYFVVNVSGGKSVTDTTVLLSRLLPFGSLDDTVRLGGRYIIRYDPKTAQVLDVFYWSESERFSHAYVSADYNRFMVRRDNREAMKSYGDKKSVIGWYGGVTVEGSALPQIELQAPLLNIVNADRLTVEITDPNEGQIDNGKYKLKLLITGLSSGQQKYVVLNDPYDPSNDSGDPDEKTRRLTDPNNGTYSYVLDSVTDARHFSALGGVYSEINGGKFYPGENVRIQVVAEATTTGANASFAIPRYAVGFNEEDGRICNSLFGDASEPETGSAEIANIRHLENLDQTVSGVNRSQDSVGTPLANFPVYSQAEQIKNLSWSEFLGGTASITNAAGNNLSTEAFYPISADSETYSGGLAYQGRGKCISGVKVEQSGRAGLFSLMQGGSVNDLELLDFAVTGTDAGALAGKTEGVKVSNVLARNSGTGRTPTVSGSGSVGGLIGLAEGGSVVKSAAALVVSSSGSGDDNANAGGLIGQAKNNTSVTACYSGGHTDQGRYVSGEFNVSAAADAGAANAGGLIGLAEGVTVKSSYSTCSAYGSSVAGAANAGGLVGSDTDSAPSSFSNCYATGQVGGGGTKGAFAGSLEGTATGCAYYEIINGIPQGANGKDGYAYLPALGSGSADIRKIDASYAEAGEVHYRDFIPDSYQKADSYDTMLNRYYQGKYQLKTVTQLNAGVTFQPGDFVKTHYGDWPAPEIFVFNP